eukprot:TRINITY_DN11510_c0_g1_i1.p1 TRINITY_DN11510_c0_g1~~TRINITY_DN11510_c0_g1_i1.p1  ORF type:complete len:291 (+),score=31.21 TRINITY_DN11510_c0_g1_i1:88-960(+)
MPRSGRISVTRVPPLQVASASSLLRGYPGLANSPRLSRCGSNKNMGVPMGLGMGLERRQGGLESHSLRDHVRRAGKVVLDIAQWSRQCDTPRKEDPTATWTAGAPIRFTKDEEEKESSVESKTDVRTPATPSFASGATGSGSTCSPFLGVEITVDRWSGTDGLKVLKVTPDSPAAHGGVKSGDYIRRVNGLHLVTKRDLKNVLLSACPTTSSGVFPSLYLDIFRPGHALLRLHVTPTAKPLDSTNACSGSRNGTRYAPSGYSGSVGPMSRRRWNSCNPRGRTLANYATSP